MTAHSRVAGLLEPWRLESNDVLYLEHDVFHALVDQPMFAQLRAALARGAGVHWAAGATMPSPLELEGAVALVAPGHYRATSAGGLTAGGRLAEVTRVELPDVPVGGYCAVALRACAPSDVGNARLSAARLPVSSGWLTTHVPLAVLRRHQEGWRSLGWAPNAVAAGDVDALIDEAGRVCDADASRVARLRPLADRLETVAAELALPSWLPVAGGVRDAVTAGYCDPSRLRLWAVVCRLRVLVDALQANTPMRLSWPRWRPSDLGAAGAVFPSGMAELLDAVEHNLASVLSAAQGLDYDFPAPADDWWSRLSVGEAMVVPMLAVPERVPGQARALIVEAVGLFDEFEQSWRLSAPAESRARGTSYLMLVPERDCARRTAVVSLDLRTESSGIPLGTAGHEVAIGGGAPWELVELGPGVAPLPAASWQPDRRVTVWQAGDLPGLRACLLVRSV